jgi:hypothetical protein
METVDEDFITGVLEATADMTLAHALHEAILRNRYCVISIPVYQTNLVLVAVSMVPCSITCTSLTEAL